MRYRRLGQAPMSVSLLGLGGHEFYPDGRMKGLSDNLMAAARPGYARDDFGGPARASLVRQAVDLGVTLFDATIDPEVEAIGRNLPNRDPGRLVQMRPQGMCYNYEAGNASLADRGALTAEVDRLRALSGIPRIGILNFAFEFEALDRPDYLERLADNIAHLKRTGRIGLAACDGLWCGERMYLRMIDIGCFDVVWINFSPLYQAPLRAVFPAARESGLAIIAREAFGKGRLPRIARDAMGEDAAAAACAGALRWIARRDDVSSIVIGCRDGGELAAAAVAVDAHRDLAPGGDPADEFLERLLSLPAAREAMTENDRAFSSGSRPR